MTETTLHVVFGSSPAGIVRRALSKLGREERVLELMDNLSLGPIASNDLDVRRSWFDKELSDFDWWEVASEDALLPTKSDADHSRLVAWYAPNRAESYAGFKWWLSQIDTDPIFIMSVPDLHFIGTNEMMRLVDQEVELSDEDRIRHNREWRSLSNEDAPLRIVQEQALVSAPLNYFDELIMGFVSTEWRLVMRVVGNAVSGIGMETGHFVDDVFICARIRALTKLRLIEWHGNMDDRRESRVRLLEALTSP